MQTFLWLNERKKSLVTQNFNHCSGYVIWTDNIDKLKEFLEFLNAFHPSIKFTMDYSPYKINHLDIFITKDESGKTLCASLYTKPFDTYQYLHAQSCHRAVYKSSIPYRKAVRMKRICSEEEGLQRKLDLESVLVITGHRAESVRREIQKANSIDRQVLLQKCTKIQEDCVTLVLTFHPALYIILKSADRIIENSQTLKPFHQSHHMQHSLTLKHCVINWSVQN